MIDASASLCYGGHFVLIEQGIHFPQSHKSQYMRSFIKSHRRGSSGALEDQLPPLNTSDSFLHTSPMASNQTSPGRTHLTSPSMKGSKLQRLFQRNKSASSNLPGMGLYPVSPGPNSTSPPPTIIGTRTHEWGSRPSQDNSTRAPVRLSTSEVSSSGSISSSAESNRLSKHTSNDDTDFLQLPLNTVLEIPDSISPSHIGATSEVRKKNLHRRAQVVTADSPMYTQPLSPALEDSPHILPTLDASIFQGLGIDDEDQPPMGAPVGLAPAAEILASPSVIQHNDGDNTTETLRQDTRPAGSITPIETPVESKEESPVLVQEVVGLPVIVQEKASDANDDANSSHESEFSFEQDGITGRNTSIRYYKNPQDVEEEQSHMAREQGFYIDDFMEDDFDEDMNYFDEDDEYNDDEALFNKKYFSDDEEEHVTKMDHLHISEPDHLNVETTEDVPSSPPDPHISSSTPFTSPPHTREHSHQKLIATDDHKEETSHLYEELNALRPKRSLKYHQLPGTYEHEFSERRYSWLSDDENASNRGSQSYDSLLDEINGIPDEFDYDIDHSHTAQQSQRSKTLNSVIKRNQGLMDGLPQNTKFETNDKTVTLFHRSCSNSLTSSTKSPEIEDNYNIPSLTSATNNLQEQFSYMTPNNSFTTPHPLFKSERDVELSPISEGSYIDDSTTD